MKKRRFYKGYSGLFAGLTLAGLFAVGWGSTIQTKAVGNVMLAVGGALLGTAIAALASTLSQNDFHAELRDVLSESLSPGLITDESMLADHRNIYLHYLVSQVDGQRVWLFSVLDFTSSQSAGRLSALIEAPDPLGNPTYYRTSAGFVDDRCIMIEKAVKGTEPAAVYIYPSFNQNFRSVQAGIGVLESWDGCPSIVPTLISRLPLVKWDTLGPIGLSLAKDLDALWLKHCPGITEFLGAVTDADTP